MHKIVSKHLKKLGYKDGVFPDGNLDKFIGFIDTLCTEADEDRAFLEHTLDTTSQEMSELYEELKEKSQTALAKSELRYKELSEKDMLVGILNRRGFYNELKRVISLSKRNNQKFAVLFLDLDYFKEINDVYGHETGDKLLKEVVSRVSLNIRVEDIFARYGGDEFVLVFTDINTLSIKELVSKTLSLFQTPWIINEHKLNITTSIGVAIYPQDADNEQELLDNADKAMYVSKRLGKNQTIFFKDI